MDASIVIELNRQSNLLKELIEMEKEKKEVSHARWLSSQSSMVQRDDLKKKLYKKLGTEPPKAPRMVTPEFIEKELNKPGVRSRLQESKEAWIESKRRP